MCRTICMTYLGNDLSSLLLLVEKLFSKFVHAISTFSWFGMTWLVSMCVVTSFTVLVGTALELEAPEGTWTECTFVTLGASACTGSGIGKFIVIVTSSWVLSTSSIFGAIDSIPSAILSRNSSRLKSSNSCCTLPFSSSELETSMNVHGICLFGSEVTLERPVAMFFPLRASTCRYHRKVFLTYFLYEVGSFYKINI